MAGRREENLESKIIIRNYPNDTSDRDLRIMFEKYGKIEDCKSTPAFLRALYSLLPVQCSVPRTRRLASLVASPSASTAERKMLRML